MRVLLVNASAPAYNLGIEKAERWWSACGATVDRRADVPRLFVGDYDVVWVSAIFSWHVPILIEAARIALDAGSQVEVGGPGTFGLRGHIRRETGLEAQARPDPRFERQPGQYRMVFWSRGCPARNCSLGYPRDGAVPVCSVPAMEGERYTLYTTGTDGVQPAPVILDNNLSALPRAHQEYIVTKTQLAGFQRVDANSGFEPLSVRPWVIELWRHLPLVAWRYAYDEIAERPDVARVVSLLDAAGIPRRKSRIYCLAGNEPLAACEQRVREIADWDCVPIVQRRRPLDWLGGPLPTLHDWTEQRLIDFQRWGNHLAKAMPFRAYRRGYKDRHAAGGLV
ncbi:MAG: hypothetical protein ACRDHF_00510 [Tepidiformaceae bacterium]